LDPLRFRSPDYIIVRRNAEGNFALETREEQAMGTGRMMEEAGMKRKENARENAGCRFPDRFCWLWRM
jgi:hypothetical protein